MFTSDGTESADNLDAVLPAMVHKIAETKGRQFAGEFLSEVCWH